MVFRFLRFNAVGALGIAVQLAALWLLAGALRMHYLVATALAIEISVLHNFYWHLRWTWAVAEGGGPRHVCSSAAWRSMPGTAWCRCSAASR